MSASKYIVPLRVEADQKDIIIGQLKQQLYLLKQNQQQFYNLEDQYRALQYKYQTLVEEKAICDGNFRSRHQAALRTLGSLRAELEDMKAEFREKNMEISDLETDQNTLRHQIDQRSIELDKLKSELKSLLADAEQLAIARRNLIETAEKTREANAILADKIHGLHLQNQTVNKKTSQTQRFLDQLLTAQKLIKQQIIKYQNQNNNIDADINTIADQIAVLDNKIFQSTNQVKNLQTAIAETDALANKFKSQAQHYYKSTQAQTLKNNDIAKTLIQAQNTLRLRLRQVDEGRQQISALAAENENLSRNNNRSQDDLQFCRKHLQNLALINSEIVKNLQQFSQEDEEVRRLVDRRGVVVGVRGRVEQTTGLLSRTTTTVAGYGGRSPMKGYY